MKIKEVADALHISPRTIRFYEDQGLIAPTQRESNGYRSYTQQELWRLQAIIALREVGLSVHDISKALDGLDNDPEELRYYLELQRSTLFTRWLEMKQMIDTSDTLIQLLEHQGELNTDDLYSLAEGSRRLKEMRNNWQDDWNFDRLAAEHDLRVNQHSDEFPAYELALEMIVRWISPQPNDKGLDLGTGTGNLAGKFALSGISISGIDQSREMLRICRSKYPGMETRLGNLVAVPYMDNTFDFVVSSFALRHLKPEQVYLALGEMRRILNSRGRICIADRKTSDHPLSPHFLKGWFDSHHYITKHEELNETVFIILAVPMHG
jgi:putative AdoMet-dependent methyltransferase